MSGPVLAILGAAILGVSSIVMRRAVIRIPDATLGVAISVPTGMLLFFFKYPVHSLTMTKVGRTDN